MQKVLVTGGCGYIGSHTIVDLIDNGFEVVSVDNLINSSEKALIGVKAITGIDVKNYAVDLCDYEKTAQIFKENNFAGIIHFAARKAVGESCEDPLGYYDNNLSSLVNVLKCAVEYRVENFIFSSSCSVYGNAKDLPVTEDTAFEEAESPYARTKQIGEKIISDYCKFKGDLNSILLRYFNPAGAHESNLLGESPVNKALNLVPVITETAIGKRESMMVYGDDYDTRDGSCIRDYIHVMDIANAHTKALQYLLENNNESNCEVYNLGIGAGVSVLEAINAFEKVSNQKLNYKIDGRRDGDVVSIYANNHKATNRLGWTPKRNIEDIMGTAWAWEQKRSKLADKTV